MKKIILLALITLLMIGCESKTDADTIDEAPMAYKPKESIINAIGDTVEIIKQIKPLYNFKANE